MFRATTLRVIAVFFTVLALMPLAGAKHLRRDAIKPVIFSICSGPIYPGELVSIEVDLSSVVAADQVVDISTATPSNWLYLPGQVTVPAGTDKVVFLAWVSPFASGLLDGSASCNGGGIESASAIAPQNPS